MSGVSSRAQKQREKLEARCRVLSDVVEQIKDIYERSETDDQRGYVETIVGAAIWYLPVMHDECWTGRISVAALMDHHPERGKEHPRLTKDHEYPRKIAAAELLAKARKASEHVANDLASAYLSKYGKFNYVTPYENKVLAKHQRKGSFQNPVEAYKRAKVELVAATKVDLDKVKARDRRTIDNLLGSTFH